MSSRRRTVLVLCLLVLPLVLGTAGAPAAPKPGGSPSGPTNLRITASTDTSASIAWDAASNSRSDWWYCVQRDGLGCYRVDPPQTTITFTRLMPGQTFNWSVITVSLSGKRSAPSNIVTFTTPPDTTPPTAPTLSVNGIWPTRVAVSWTSSTDISGADYALLVDGSPYSSGEVALRQLTVLDLEPATTHTFTVLARDRFGNTSESNTVTVTTPATSDNTPPTAPTNLRLGPETTLDEIWLEWDPSTDDRDSQGLILYEILLNGVRDHRVIGGTNTIVYCPAVVPARITVRGVDTSGNVSALSNELTFC
jgi:chitodextrinase